MQIVLGIFLETMEFLSRRFFCTRFATIPAVNHSPWLCTCMCSGMYVCISHASITHVCYVCYLLSVCSKRFVTNFLYVADSNLITYAFRICTRETVSSFMEPYIKGDDSERFEYSVISGHLNLTEQ